MRRIDAGLLSEVQHVGCFRTPGRDVHLTIQVDVADRKAVHRAPAVAEPYPREGCTRADVRHRLRLHVPDDDIRQAIRVQIADGPRVTKVYFGSRQGTVVRFASDSELIVEAPGGKPNEKVNVLIIFDPGGQLTIKDGFTFVEKGGAPSTVQDLDINTKN